MTQDQAIVSSVLEKLGLKSISSGVPGAPPTFEVTAEFLKSLEGKKIEVASDGELDIK